MSALILPAWWSVAIVTSLTLRAVAVPRAFDPDLRMACGVAPILLGMVYRHRGIAFRLVAGRRRGSPDPHNWVETNGHVVDLTATQYGDEAVARVVPVLSRLYIRSEVGTFEEACAGLRAEPPDRGHYWNPRRHHEVIAEALAIVRRIPIGVAAAEVTATIGAAVLADRLQPVARAPLHPRDMPEPPAGAAMRGPGSCAACSAPSGCHVWWCAMRGASDGEIARLRAKGGGS